ncbi:MAG TPA: choice-of-anchor Q domain-containing protein [Baekduia sp.]|nr:choice-of-anchor Q domain-containing protein [Baekduia sp.]
MTTYGRARPTRAAVVLALAITCGLAAAGDAGGAPTSCAGLAPAITAANAAPGPDVIDLVAGSVCRINAPLPVVSDGLTIDGHGARLRPAADTSMVLLDADGQLGSSALTLTVANLTMSGGSPAIWAFAANVVVKRSRLENNDTGVYVIFGSAEARFSRIAHNGGGLFGDFAVVEDSELVDNGVGITANQDAQAVRSLVRANGTGITANETASAYGSRVDGNGTGLSSAAGRIELGGSRLTDNEVGVAGGSLGISDSVIARNANVGATQYETALAGSTLYDNAHGLEANGGARISNSTFARGEDLTVRGGSVDFTTVTGTLHSDQAIALTNSIILGCDGVFSEEGPASGASGNVSPDAGCPGRAVTGDPRLRPLADNGGPTPTQALGLASPARDVVAAAACGLAVDQRGLPRPSGPACDAGAFEAQVSSPAAP